MATTPQAIPPTYSVAKQGNTHLQATDAMAAWMQLINKQVARAIAVLPASNVTTTTDPAAGTPIPLPENVILVGGPDGTNVQALPDPGLPDEILVSAGPGQLPRWTTLAELGGGGIVGPTAHQTEPPHEATPEQQAIIDHIVFLLYELIRISKAT